MADTGGPAGQARPRIFAPRAETILPPAGAWGPSQRPKQQRTSNVSASSLRNLRRRVQPGGGADDDDPRDYMEQVDHAAGEGLQGLQEPAAGTEYAARETRAHEAWQGSLPFLRRAWIHMTPLILASRLARRHRELQDVEACAAEAWRFHECSNKQLWDETPEDSRVVQLQVQRPRQVTYFGALARHRFTLPEWRCNCCRQEFEPAALHAGCWPSSPSRPDAWIDVLLMQQYSVLGLREGQSCTGFVAMYHEQQDLYATADVELARGGSQVQAGPAITAHVFEQAWMAFLRTTTDLTSLSGLGVHGGHADDPLAGCPVCADVPRCHADGTLDIAVAGQEYHPSIAMDAVTKPGHYANCARATKHLQPLLGIHFSTANDEVQARHANATLDTQVVCAHADVDEDVSVACSSELHCARTSAKETGAVDVHGVVGTVCTHGIPVRGGFCDMPTPEIFSYYLILLTHILALARGIRDVYVDFACKLRVTWARYLAGALGSVAPEAASRMQSIRLLVNWLHAAGHKLDCQIQHSGRHTHGAGRRVGENTEQLWSLVKAPAGLVRYMRLANRRDFLDALFTRIAEDGLPRMVALLRQRYDNTVALLATATTRLHTAVADANRADVDIHAAQLNFEQHTKCSGQGHDTLTGIFKLKVQLVDLMLTATAEDHVAKFAHYIVPVSAPTVRKLLSQCHKSPAIRKKIEKLQRDLGINDNWPHEQPADFQACKVKAVQQRVYSVLLQLQEAALDVIKMHRERDEVGLVDRVTKSLRGRIKRRTTKVYNLADEVGLLSAVGEMPELALSRDQVQEVLHTGQLPAALLAGVDAQELHHGKALFMARADVARCHEELPLLRIEMRRLLGWVRCMRHVVTRQLEQEQAHGKMPSMAECMSLSMAQIAVKCAQAEPAAGKQFWLFRHLRLLLEMEAEASKPLPE